MPQPRKKGATPSGKSINRNHFHRAHFYAYKRRCVQTREILLRREAESKGGGRGKNMVRKCRNEGETGLNIQLQRAREGSWIHSAFGQFTR